MVHAYIPPKTLVVSGAGANAVVELGALWTLNEYLKKVQLEKSGSLYDHFSHYRGVSAGALICTLLALRIPITRIMELMHYGVKCMLHSTVSICGSMRRFGLGHMRGFREMLEEHLGAPHTFASFFESTGKCLGVGVTRLRTRTFHMLTRHTHPHIKIVDAVIASISIPLMTHPVRLGGEMCVDGGTSVNFPYPIHYWVDGDATESFGLAMRTAEKFDESTTLSGWSVGKHICMSLLFAQNAFTDRLIAHHHPEHVVSLYSHISGLMLSECLRHARQREMVRLGVIFMCLHLGKSNPRIVLAVFPRLVDVLSACYCAGFLIQQALKAKKYHQETI